MSSTSGPGAPLNIPDALQRAHAHWNAGQAEQAEIWCQRVLAVWPGQADALHLLGLMAHAYGNLDLAIAHLTQACLAPRAPAVYSSNLAEMLRQKGRLAEGEEAARRAVAMDPTLVSGWNNLGILLQEAGKFDESRACLERVVALQPDWAEAHNNLGNTYRRLEQLDKATTHYRQALALKPSYAEAHSNLAFLLCAHGDYEAAAAEARLAIDLNPRLVDGYLNLAEAESLRHRHEAVIAALDAMQSFAPLHLGGLVARANALRRSERYDKALACARQAVEIAPQSAEAHNALGGAHQSLGHQDEALRAFATAAELPGTVREEALLGVAMVLMEAGRKEEALAAFGRVLEAFPHSHRVLAARADLKTFVAGDPDIATMEALLAEGERRPIADRMGAHFALGKAYLDSGDSARAFRHFDAGNRHKRANTDYDSASAAAWLKDIADIFTAESMGRYADAGAPGDLPIFVIGMPRSGTTLVEQILSSHSQITGAGELAAFRLAVEGTGSKYPDLMRTLARDDLHRLGEDYLARTRPLAGASARLVDKMPANFIHAGLIALALPQARIVHCRRDPVDTCLSCYTKLFAGDQKFAYDQTELGEFYRAYEGLMTHWRTVLPADRFIEVDYENVVDDLETEARRLVAFTGLPWEDACLSFHENRRVVRTASVNQVRQPIYRTSKGRWRKYADHLGPLLAALGIAP